MGNPNEILDQDDSVIMNDVEDQYIISVNKFIFLSIITFGVYEIWWMYKAWKFYQQKEKLDITPAARAIFSIFFLNSLFVKILESAKEKGYEGSYSSVSLFIGFFIGNLLGRLPDPFWLLSVFSFVFVVPPFKALNFAKQHSTGFTVIEQTSFNGRQIGLIIAGAIIWSLGLMGLAMEQ